MTRKKTTKHAETKKDLDDDVIASEVIDDETLDELEEEEEQKSTKTKKKKKKDNIMNDLEEDLEDTIGEAVNKVGKVSGWLEHNRQKILGAILVLMAIWLLREVVIGVILMMAGALLLTGYFEKE